MSEENDREEYRAEIARMKKLRDAEMDRFMDQRADDDARIANLRVDLTLARLERDTELDELNGCFRDASRLMTPEILDRMIINILGPRDVYLSVELLYCAGHITADERDSLLTAVWNSKVE